jgi:hypothetical protein
MQTKDMYVSCDIVDVHYYEDWSCCSNIWGSIAQNDIIYNLFKLLCVLSWHCSKIRGSDLYHQGGKMGVGKKMATFKCMLGSCWYHKAQSNFRIHQGPKRRINIRKVVRIVDYKERPKRTERKMKGSRMVASSRLL